MEEDRRMKKMRAKEGNREVGEKDIESGEEEGSRREGRIEGA